MATTDGKLQRLDHGLLNIPLAKRGNIDAQIDRFKAERDHLAAAAHIASFWSVREKRSLVVALLARISDERVLELAAPLKKRTATTARAALAQMAGSNLDAWIKALQREPAALSAGAAQ